MRIVTKPGNHLPVFFAALVLFLACESVAQAQDAQDVTNSIGMQLKLIPAGQFTMGTDTLVYDYDVQYRPAHQVTLSKSYYMGVHEVTQAQYRRVTVQSPSLYTGDQLPVEQVSYNDAVDFCRRLSELPAEKAAGRVYRLPTEAEWEHACRAGTDTVYSFGNDPDQLGQYAWYGPNANQRTHPVGQLKPNPWGLYDMHGNVAEHTADLFADYSTSGAAETDPTGPASSDDGNVVRGGACGYPADVVRIVVRYVGGSLTYSNGDRGFRVAVSSSSRPIRTAGTAVSNTIDMEFAPIPGGSFMMGSPENEVGRGFGDRETQVAVTLSKNFWMGKCEVTQKQWMAVMSRGNPSFEAGDNLPVNGIGHRNATDFCTTLTYSEHQAGKLSKDWTYRLPTDAEWEYACRAGTTTRFSFGDDARIADDYAWHLRNSSQNFHPVGLKKPNKWGLYDMHGNASEWCLDTYQAQRVGGTDPIVEGTHSRSPHIVRGGSKDTAIDYCRSASTASETDAQAKFGHAPISFRAALVYTGHGPAPGGSPFK